MSDISVRRATIADLDLVAPLFDAYRQFYGKPADIEVARAFIAERLQLSDSVIFLATNSRQSAAGFAQLYPAFSSVSARRLWILNDLFVAPDCRRSGHAQALMEAAREHAAATGAVRLCLSTAHSNIGAQRLYESLGYIRDDEFFHYVLEDLSTR